jgi:CHAD domain-containing protein
LKSLQSKSQDISQSSGLQQKRINPHSAHPIEHLRQLTAKLKENLALCTGSKDHEPTVDAVHDVRTGTRRIEAILDSMQSSMQRNSTAGSTTTESTHQALGEAVTRWQRLLRKIRRSAGAVRDLDVHRRLLRDLLKSSSKDVIGPDSAVSEAAPAPPVQTPLQKQAEDLDAWLRHTRHEHSQPLVEGAKKWSGKLDAQLAAITEALQAQPAQRRKPISAAVTALEAFAQLSSEMQQLYADNLHDFRKGAKKARYMAETGGEDEYAGAVGKALKKLQDEIGDWHDWLVLAEEAHSALGDQGVELTARIEHEREKHYASAMKTAERMRGRLMGEWRASASTPRRVTHPARL